MAGTHSSVGVNPSAIAAVSDWYRAVKACTARRPASPALLSSAVAGAARPAITTTVATTTETATGLDRPRPRCSHARVTLIVPSCWIGHASNGPSGSLLATN